MAYALKYPLICFLELFRLSILLIFFASAYPHLRYNQFLFNHHLEEMRMKNTFLKFISNVHKFNTARHMNKLELFFLENI